MKYVFILLIMAALPTGCLARDPTSISIPITTDHNNVSYWLTEKPSSRAAIRDFTAQLFAQHGGKQQFVIIPDPTTSFDTVCDLVAMLRLIGFSHCAVISNQYL